MNRLENQTVREAVFGGLAQAEDALAAARQAATQESAAPGERGPVPTRVSMRYNFAELNRIEADAAQLAGNLRGGEGAPAIDKLAIDVAAHCLGLAGEMKVLYRDRLPYLERCAALVERLAATVEMTPNDFLRQHLDRKGGSRDP